MRRRLWAYIRHIDTLIAFHLGLPASIRDTDCDAEMPRNIFDYEFDTNSTELPPSRPMGEATPMSCLITKCAIVLELSKILEFQSALHSRSVSYDEIMKHDNILQEIKTALPQHLKIRPVEECMHDSAQLSMHRFNLEVLWLKSMCVLHRPHLVRARHNPRYTHSRRSE